MIRKVKLRELLKENIKNGVFNDPNKIGSGYRLINVVDLYTEPYINANQLGKVDICKDEFLKYKVKKGDLFFIRSSIKYEGIARCNIFKEQLEDVCFECHIMRVRIDENILLPEYLFYYAKTFEARKYFMQRAKFTTMATIDQGDLLDFEIPVISIDSQMYIVEVLSDFDSAIEKTEQLIWAKEEYKKGLMQKLLKGDGKYKTLKNKSLIKKLKGVVIEVSERNTKNAINLVLSVTNSHGFRLQSDHFDKVIASKDVSNYKIVRKGQFGYNPSRVNVGSIARLEEFEAGILSPMYVIFKTDETKLLPEYMKYFIQTWAFEGQVEYLTQGSVRDSLNFDSLEQMEIYLPSIKEQQVAVNLLELIDKEIELMKKKCDFLKLQKKGLMQKLLTGKLRVKTKGEK